MSVHDRGRRGLSLCAGGARGRAHAGDVDGLCGRAFGRLSGAAVRLSADARNNQALAAGLRAFFDRLGVEKPVFIGASDGGMVAQIYA